MTASFNNSIISPACHCCIRFSNDFKWSFYFDFREGFCKRRLRITITSLNAISFNGDSCIHLFISLEISTMKLFPSCPDGNKNRFFLQYTVFRKREIIKQIILIIATFILQWWIWNISNLSIWIIRCLVFCIVFISFIWCLNISDFVLQITWSKVLIKASLRAETSATLDAYMRMSIWICTCVCYILYIRPSKEPPVQS